MRVTKTSKICKKRKIKDPTGKIILINGKRYKQLIKLGCKLNKDKTALVFPKIKGKDQAKKLVLNPDTGRSIYVNGSTFKRLLTIYHYDKERNIFITSEAKEQPQYNGKYWKINTTPLTEGAQKLVIEARTLYSNQVERKYFKTYFYNNINSLKDIHESLDSLY